MQSESYCTRYEIQNRALKWTIIEGLKQMCKTIWRICSAKGQGGITCGAIDEPRKSSKAIDKRVIIDFRDKNVVIARFRDQNEVFI